MLEFAPTEVLAKKYQSSGNIDYTSADIEPGRAMVQMSITDIKYPDESFDCLIAFHVMEHIPDDAKAMSELYRVLKKGGWAILQVPLDINLEKTYEDPSITDPAEREKAYGQNDHVRQYGLDYKDKLVAAGFTVTVDDYVKSFSPEEIEKFGLDQQERIYFCQKQ